MAEWYSDLGPISIGCQSNGHRGNWPGAIKVELWKALRARVTGTHTQSVDHFGLVLRVGGEFGDFSPGRTHRIRRSKKKRYITCDIDIPAANWQTRTDNELKSYLAERVRGAVQLLVKRLQSDNEAVDSPALFEEVDAAIRDFLSCVKPEQE